MTSGGYLLAATGDSRGLRLASWGWTVRSEGTAVEVRHQGFPRAMATLHSGASAVIAEDGHIDFLQHYDSPYGNVEGRLTASDYAPITNAKLLAIAEDHACIVDTDGIVRGVGKNDVGQLGDGTTVDRRTFAPVLWAREGSALK